MSVSLLEGVAAAAPAGGSEKDPDTKSVTTAADIASAKVAARLSGKRVEALSERTETSTTWVNKDGSLTTELAAGPVRFERDGRWTDVDVNLREAESGVEPVAHPGGLRLAGRTGTPAKSLAAAQEAKATDLVTLGEGDQQIRLQWKGGLPEPKLDGPRAEYVNAVPGADVIVEATRTGFEQLVEIKQRPTTNGYTYTLPLKAKGLKVKQLADRSIQFTDTKNKKRAVMPAPVMWDATVDKRSGEHTNRAEVGLKVVDKGSSVDLVLTPDAKFLADPETTYPVTVDPSTSSLSNVFDTYVQQGETVDWSADTELDLGNPGTTNSDGTPRTARSFISWNTTPIQDALVLDAKLSLWNFHSGNNTDCKVYPWEVWSTGAASTSSRWTAQPSWTAKKATSTETRGNAACTTQPDGWINADATTLVQEWASAKATRGHMGLRATSETVVAQWKRVNSANAASNPPKLVVNYNYRPRTGTKQEAGPPYFSYSGAYTVNTTTPALRDTFVDSDGDKVNGTFQIYDNATNTQVGDVIVSKYVPSGQIASVSVPSGVLSNGKTYKFRTSPYDGTHYNNGWSAWKTFTVDTSAPSAPTKIVSTDYPSSSWVKGAGQAGTFTVTPPASDHNWLEWSLDGVTWTKVATGGSTADKALSITPPKDGTHTLQVRSVDKADNKSEAIEYTFHAGPGGFVQPSEGERTARRLPLVAEADASKYNSVSFSWRRSEADGWQRIPVGDVTSGGNALTAWPVPLTNGKNSQLVWNAVATVNPDGAVQVKADFTGANSASGSTEPLTVVVDRYALGAAPQLIGPGSVNLLTGDFTLSEVEASYFGLSVTRTATSRTPSAGDQEGQVAIFGNEWASGTVAESAGSDYSYVSRVSDTAVDVVGSQGDAIHFTANAAKTAWIAEPGAEKITLQGSTSGSFTLTDAEGTVTDFAKLDDAATTWQVSSARLDGRSNSTTTVLSETVSTDGKVKARPKRVVAPTSAVASGTCAQTPSTRGCRVLEFVYATSTTATAGTYGDFTGRVKEIQVWSTAPGATTATSTSVQKYMYDTTGRLRRTWNSQISPQLVTEYAYDSAGRVTELTPPGQLPWTFTYGQAGSSTAAGPGMLLSVSRPGLQPGTAATVQGEAVTSLVYDVPLTGASAPYAMGSSEVKTWGQLDAPTDATAIFPADSVPASHTGSSLGAGSYARATIQYMDASGRQINAALPGGHISASDTDRFGNTIRELTPANRALALGQSGAAQKVLTDLGIADLPSAERADLLSTRSIYNATGTRELEALGPLSRIDLTQDLTSGGTTLVSAGTSVVARARSVNTYDSGRPTDGTATVKDQITGTTSGAQLRVLPAVHAETRETRTVYDWARGLATQTVQDPGGLAITTVTQYDEQGRVTKEIRPDSTATSATTRVTDYWSASGTGTCAGRPEWADLPCRTSPGGAITGGGSNPSALPVTTTEYDRWGNPTNVSETAGGVTRTTTTSYDDAGRPISVAMTGGVGEALSKTTTDYDPATGEAIKNTSATSGTITKVFDALGRQLSYTDADGGVTQVRHDLLNRVTQVSDSVPSTVTYTYDHAVEPRGLATKTTDSVAGAFETAYDADGAVISERLPGGYTLAQEIDTTGSPLARTYTRASDSTVVLADSVDRSIHSQVTAHSGWSHQQYRYDAVGRLAGVDDTADTVCTRRTYTFGARSTRTAVTTAISEPGVDCPSSAGTTTSHTYDSADRLAGTGYVYDAFGRTTTAPGHGSLSYHANDLVYRQTVDGKRQTWQRDPELRVRSWTTESGSGTTWTQTASRINHYDSDSDNPRWVVEDTGTGAVTRNIVSASGNLTATSTKTGGVVLQLANMHGDIALQLPLDGATAPTVLDYDEYGNPRPGQAGTRYAWLGTKQRSADTLTGLTLMGVRLYDPKLGRFLQADPVPGGSANAYDYANADPCNSSDTTGLIPKCGKKHKTNGYNLQIITSRRGGGVTKDGHRYIGYYVETQIKGFANRYLSRNAVYAETWGTRPGKRRMGKLQGKASWYTPWKKQWEVHYNIQVKPGTRIVTHGNGVVLGWNGFVTAVSSICKASA
ncbi:DNRLRE domain-containing protein [Streptomyces canus]|uniref:DNRLRE domain-containing protein n=1 Tax=Streptomyces canus TaxID=58343 RepID=UPI002E3674C2|nr:DNRLRE domain-containing protein [Streptomyces canus]